MTWLRPVSAMNQKTIFAAVAACCFVAAFAHAQDTTSPAQPESSGDGVSIELNKLEKSEKGCRAYVVVTNPTSTSYDAFKLDLVLFNTEGAVYRRMLVDMAPVRANKTVVKTFGADGDCAQLGSVLVNEVTACQPGEPGACQDQLALSSRVKNVRLYK